MERGLTASTRGLGDLLAETEQNILGRLDSQSNHTPVKRCRMGIMVEHSYVTNSRISINPLFKMSYNIVYTATARLFLSNWMV